MTENHFFNKWLTLFLKIFMIPEIILALAYFKNTLYVPRIGHLMKMIAYIKSLLAPDFSTLADY